MTFDLTTIAILAALAAPYNLLISGRLRTMALMVGSALAVYWLQPRLDVRHMDFILPTLAIVLVVAAWLFTRPRDAGWRLAREDWITLAAAAAVIVGVASTRYLAADLRLTARPPDISRVAPALIGGGLAIYGAWRISGRVDQRGVLTGAILLITGLFVVLKAEALATLVAEFARERQGQDASLTSPVDDIGWVGFSYLAFRLIHTMRDRQSGRLPAMSLRAYFTYALFFPSFIAGPIDRAERFDKDYTALPDLRGRDAERTLEGLTRICVGIFKKFVVADTIALGMALNGTNVDQTTSTLGLWVLLYGYSLRLFFDFSGYSDIAIGIGLLFGVRLPENFDRPYLKTNIASFWQSWHMTLSAWARFYIFTPFSRTIMRRNLSPSPALTVLSAQAVTMIVIGLWHGITFNFFIWGLWHGAGLFIHKQWSDRTRKRYLALADKPGQKRMWALAGWFVTLHFVVIGWVWFALPTVDQSVDALARLAGL